MSDLNYSRLRAAAIDLQQRARELLKQQPTAASPGEAGAPVEPLKIAFIGQYNAGKSSLIKMLTGVEDIVIGAGVTTSKVTFYAYQGLQIADTPGIRAGHCETHDAQAQKAMVESDLLVFVVTNELFDNLLGADFRRLCNRDGRAREMMIVINKSQSDPGETQTKLSAISPVLDPWIPEDFEIVFTDARSWLDALDEDDDFERQDLAAQSNRSGLVEGIDRFVANRGLYARITTPLQEMEAALHATLDEAGGGTPLEKGMLLLMNQSKRIFRDARREHAQEVRALLEGLHEKINQQGSTLADAVGGDADEFERLQKGSDSACKKLVDQAVRDIHAAQERRQADLEDQLNELAKTPLGGKIRDALRDATSGAADPTAQPRAFSSDESWKFDAKMGQSLAKTAEKGLAFLAKSAVGDATKSGLKAVSGSSLHEAVKSVGGLVGFKFEAWQAVKIADTIGKGAKFLGPVVALAGVGMQVYDDHQQSKLADRIRDAKRDVRKGFHKFAQEVEVQLHQGIDEGLQKTYDLPIELIEEQLSGIRERNDAISSHAQATRSLLEDVGALRTQIGLLATR